MPVKNIWTAAVGFFGLTGVALGAVAAHGVSDAHAAEMLQRAATYQVMHAVALLALSLSGGVLHPRLSLAVKAAWALGMLGFTGGIALHYLAGMPSAGQLAPVGGTCLMAGWALLILAPCLRPAPLPPRE